MKTVNRGLSAFCSFLVGAGLGVTIAWHFAKIKYEKIADEEIESMKKVLLKDKEKDNENSEKKKNISKLDEIVNNEGYKGQSTNYATVYNKKKTQKNDVETYIHPIPSDEFGLEEEYDSELTTYNAIGNIEEKIGEDFAKYFEESNGDTIYFKNDKYKAYYEVVQDDRSFDQVR